MKIAYGVTYSLF